MKTSPIEVQKALKGMDYPASKQELIKKAKDNDAPREVMDVLENLPDKDFESAVDVSKEFKGEEGGGGRGGRGGQGQGGQGGNRSSQESGGNRGGSSRGGQESSGRSSHGSGEGISHRGAGSPPIETQKALKGMDYPARKQEILEKAKSNDAPREVMQILEDIPDREYESAVDVSKEFKGETGHIGEESSGRGGNRGGNKGGR